MAIQPITLMLIQEMHEAELQQVTQEAESVNREAEDMRREIERMTRELEVRDNSLLNFSLRYSWLLLIFLLTVATPCRYTTERNSTE